MREVLDASELRGFVRKTKGCSRDPGFMAKLHDHDGTLTVSRQCRERGPRSGDVNSDLNGVA